MSETSLNELMKHWDYKLTLYCIAVMCTLSYWAYWKNVPLDHDSVYRQSGVFQDIYSCGGSLNAKLVKIRDDKGNLVIWSRKKCDEDSLQKLIGKKYVAYYSTIRDKRSPISLEVGGDVYFKPGINHRDILAVLGIGFVVCFFTVVPVLHKRRKRKIESQVG